MLRPIKSCFSLRALLVVMIAAPILPTLALTPAILMQLGRSWHQLFSLAELVLLGAGARLFGGGVALAAAGQLIRSMRTLARAAKAPARAPDRRKMGVVEIDTSSGRWRSPPIVGGAREVREAQAARRDSEARLRDFAESGSDGLEADRNHHFAISPRYPQFGQDPISRLGRARWELASDRERAAQTGATTGPAGASRAVSRIPLRKKVGNQPEQTVSVCGKPIFDAPGNFRATAEPLETSVRRSVPSATVARGQGGSRGRKLRQIAVLAR